MTYFQRTFHKLNADPKPEKIVKPKKAYKYVRKATGEAAIFEEIWRERPHSCQVCGEHIPEPSPSNFAHILPKAKNKYPLFKLNKQNICLFCLDCHHTWDFQRHYATGEYWHPIFHLEDSLKEQYKKLP